MDNIAVWGYALSCILPLVAFILLLLQVYRQSTAVSSKNVVVTQIVEEVPFHMGGLISIASDIERTEKKTDCGCQESARGSDVYGEMMPLEQKYLNMIGRQAFELGRFVLNGCNVGLARMIYLNKQYFGSRKVPGSPRQGRDMRRRKNPVVTRDWFQPTRLVTIVQGLQY